VGLKLHLELPADSPWAERLAPLQAELRGARVDGCAQVEIRAEGSGVIVRVTSRGRSTSRRLQEPSELVRTVEALVVLPPTSQPPTEPDSREEATAEPPPLPPPEPTHLEIAAAAALRIGGDVYVGGGFSALADVVVDNYVLGVAGRWDVDDSYVSEPTASGFNMQSGALGVLLGRRLPARPLLFDALLDAQIVIENQGQNGVPDVIGGPTLDTRFGAALRILPKTTAGFRAYALLDVEASPARVARPKRLDPSLPLLPTWTSGVAVGVMWGPQ
jgi:hypothetical protein